MWLIFKLLGSLPFWISHRIADVGYFLNYYVILYRHGLIRRNIRDSFPCLPRKLLTAYHRKHVLQLMDYAFETMRLAAQKTDAAANRIARLSIHEEISRWLETHISKAPTILVLAGHQFNWECTLWKLAAWARAHRLGVIVVYEPNAASAWTDVLVRARTNSGARVVAAGQLTSALLAPRKNGLLVLVAADAAPNPKARTEACQFLNRPTAFDTGIFSLANRKAWPVFAAETHPAGKRGIYEVALQMLQPDASAEPPGQLLARYCNWLEASILKHPHNWLWSARRWPRH